MSVNNQDDKKIKVLWLCNLMPSFVGEAMGVKGTNKEGWISGMYGEVKKHDDISLAVAFPSDKESKGNALGFAYYSFAEDSEHPENLNETLTKSLRKICDDFKPDVIHCFGTEYAHTRALLEDDTLRDKALLHLQGLMEECEKEYFAGLPEKIINHNTFRDIVKRDGLRRQKEKFRLRSENENKIISLAKNICGRTSFDEKFAKKKNPGAKYFRLNETLREEFYTGEKWDKDKAVSHRVFVSQGNYPLKGVHTVIEAAGYLKEKYPDITVNIAGDDIVRDNSLMSLIKLPGYGKYLKSLIKKYNLTEKVRFIGQQNADGIKRQMLECSVFVLPSFMENSPNSLGEAMLLGVPCVCSNAGGIPSLADDGKEVLMSNPGDVTKLKDNISKVFDDAKKAKELSENGIARAGITHNREKNYEEALRIYREIAGF